MQRSSVLYYYRFDAETGLYYYRARYYSARLGRFLQTDPIGTKDDLNLYAYVYNDPLNETDPTGACVWDACVVETVAAAEILAWLGGLTLGVIALNEIEKSKDEPKDKPKDGARIRTDDKGKVHGDLPNADDVPEDDLEKSAGALEESIRVREKGIADHPVGDPNGSAKERRQHRQHEQHKERVKRERKLLEELRKRQQQKRK